MLPENIRYDIGDRIRRARTKKGLSQMDFSESIDISVNFLSEIENGKKGFSYETLYKICDKHQLSADYILFGEHEKVHSYDQLIKLSNTMSCDDLRISVEYLSALLKMKEAAEKE